MKLNNIEYGLRFKFDFMYIPEDMYFMNCRSMLDTDSWNKIRFAIYKRDEYTCQCCGNKTYSPEAHEVFKVYPTKYNMLAYLVRYFKRDIFTYFKLTEIVTLCNMCHKSVHIKRAYKKNDGSLKECIKHLAKVFDVKEEFIDTLISEFVFKSYKLKEKYSHYIFKLDLEYLLKFAMYSNIKLKFTDLNFKVPNKYTSYIENSKLNIIDLNNK